MRKHSKLIFYSLSVAILGGFTIWEILAVRSAQIGGAFNNKDAVGVEQIRSVVAEWTKREKFSFTGKGEPVTPSVSPDPTRKVANPIVTLTQSPDASVSGEEE